MRVIEITEPGDPDVLRVAQRPTPGPGPGELLVAVEAAGVCRADVLQRKGAYPPPPGHSDIPGLEVAGTVAAVGPGVRGWRIGERVCALCNGGGYAEFVLVPYQQALPIPRGWSAVEAATLPENLFTVYDNLFTRARVVKGELALIHGGTSGIGTTALMLCAAFGVRTIATAGSPQKCAACRELGAELAVDYKTTDFVREVRRFTGGAGVDAILDIVGGAYIGRDLEILASDGRIACIATQGGRMAEVDLGLLMSRRAILLGSSLRARTAEQKGAIGNALRKHVWPLLPAKNPIRPLIDAAFPLECAADAHRRLESGGHVGKIVLIVAPGNAAV